MEPEAEKVSQAKNNLLKILGEAILILALPGNDFLWSFWEGPEEAIAELVKLREQIARDDFSHLIDLEVIFAPTGALQEVSISSGWGAAFLDLAARFDDAVVRLR